MNGLEKKIQNEKGEGCSLVIELAALGIGAFHGYCDTQQIPFTKESMHTVLTWGPAFAIGSFGAVGGGLAGMFGGGVLGVGVGAVLSEGKEEHAVLSMGIGGACGAATGGLFCAGLVGGLAGGLTWAVTGMGYLIGSGVGYVLR